MYFAFSPRCAYVATDSTESQHAAPGAIRGRSGGAGDIVVRRIRRFRRIRTGFRRRPAGARPPQRGYGQQVIHAISLAAILFGLWLLLSGHYTPLLIGIGGASAIFAVVVALRMDVVDHEGHPLRLGLRVLGYWPWLLWQILRANLDVSRAILSPSLPISPETFPYRAGQKTELGQVVFANSITLTPGTVTVAEEDGELVVHALTGHGADDIRGGEMDRRVTALEGRT